jgi:hypothetical protein
MRDGVKELGPRARACIGEVEMRGEQDRPGRPCRCPGDGPGGRGPVLISVDVAELLGGALPLRDAGAA